MIEGGRVLAGEEEVAVWAGETTNKREGFPPERDRGLGSGGFDRVEEDLEREPKGAPAGKENSLVTLTVAAGISVSDFSPSIMGSDADLSPPGGMAEKILLSNVGVSGC